MSTLMGLSPAARVLVADEAFRTGDVVNLDVDQFVIENIGLGRCISLEPLRAVITEARRRFGPRHSDSWLAPRLHATLRLTRREAADRRIWEYLSVVEFPAYVRWRWRDPDAEAPVPIDYFVGDDMTNAVSRLWWAAELIRNGADYAPTVTALADPRFASSWLRLNVMHHRAAALAVVDFLGSIPDGEATDDKARMMARAVNVGLRTLSLDALALSPVMDAEAVREWCEQSVDETTMMSDLPRGPDEPPVPAADVAAVRVLLDHLAEQARPSGAESNRSAPALTS